jgi:tetratricopeptide (TPR) repeat protein
MDVPTIRMKCRLPVRDEREFSKKSGNGACLSSLGRIDEAVACYDFAIRLQPEYPNAHWNWSLVLLAKGDYERGWAEYEWRWQRAETKTRHFPEPRWDGSFWEGNPALVSYNSGHTDVVRRANSILVEGHKPLEQRTGAKVTAIWNDPSLEETIDKLEWCYQNRDQLPALAKQAAADMRLFSWDRLAEALLEIVRRVEAAQK